MAAPQSAFTFPIPESPAAERLASGNGDSSSGRLPSGFSSAATDQRSFANGNSSSGHHLSGLSSAATDRQALTNGDSSSGRLPSNVSSTTREELAGMSTMELGGAPIHQQRRCATDIDTGKNGFDLYSSQECRDQQAKYEAGNCGAGSAPSHRIYGNNMTLPLQGSGQQFTSCVMQVIVRYSLRLEWPSDV